MFSCYCLSFSKTVQKPAYFLFWQFDAVLKNKVLDNDRNFKPLLVQAQHSELCVVAHDYLNAANVDNETFLHYKNKRWLLSVCTSRSHLDIVHACIFLLKLLALNKPLTAKWSRWAGSNYAVNDSWWLLANTYVQGCLCRFYTCM